MKTCGYTFRNKEKCREVTRQNSEFCILHIDLPEDEESDEFREINELKNQKVEEKVSKEDFNFEGARLLEVDFSGKKIKKNLDFNNAVIRRNALFKKAEMGRNALFKKATIGGDVRFIKAMIGGDTGFEGATIGGDVRFGGAMIEGYARFGGAKIGGNAGFEGATIVVNAGFRGAKICKDASFDRTKIGERIEFKGTTFKNPEAQENACRTAKNIWKSLGDREEEDYYHYREMEAKRKQKNLVIRVLEFPIQYIFGYGIYPFRVMITWGLTVLLFALIFWIFNGVGRVGNGVEGAESFLENLYFSILTATTLSYGDYRPNPGYQSMAGILAVFGTFMWAAFIAIFARKYMR